MAYRPVNPGWGAGSSTYIAPKPKPKPTKSFDPYGAAGGFTPQQLAGMTPGQLAQVQFGMSLQGPPAPDFGKLRSFATAQAQQQAAGPASFYQQERDYQAGRQRMSSEAATNFAAAFADILQGGKSGEEGQQYALENFGGSYLGGIAARMGQELIAKQQEHFTEVDMKLAGQLADIMDAIPDEAEKIYKDLVEQTQDILTAPYKNQLAAIASLIKNKRDDQKALLDATKALGGGTAGATKKQVVYVGDAAYLLDPYTGKKTLIGKGAPKPGKPTVRTVNGVLVEYDPATKTWNPAQGNLPPKSSSSSTAAGKKPQAVVAKLSTELRANVSEWAAPLEVSDEDRLRISQELTDRGVKSGAAFTAKYIADDRFFKNGRWMQVFPGGLTNDPKKAKRALPYDTILAQAMDQAADLYDLGWSQARVRAWVVKQLRALGITR